MFRWVPYPFLRFTPALILGVLVGLYSPWSLPAAAIAALVVLYGITVVALPARWRQRLSTLLGTVGLLIIVGVGVVRVNQHRADQRANHLSHYQSAYSHYVATVTSDADERKNSWRTTARLERMLLRDSTRELHAAPPREANILIYQPKADSLRLLRYGDQIVVEGTPQRIEPPTNPHTFDQQRYWANQQVYHQHYLRANQWQTMAQVSLNPMTKATNRLRRQSKALLTQAVADPSARGIALALVLGVKDQLDDQVREAYSRAGAMHVLAVSGLHIGIVYGVVAFLLGFLQRTRRGRPTACPGVYCHPVAVCVGYRWLSVRDARRHHVHLRDCGAGLRNGAPNIFNTLALSAFFAAAYQPLLPALGRLSAVLPGGVRHCLSTTAHLRTAGVPVLVGR